MKINPGSAIALGFFACLIGAVIAWAITTDEIWRNVYDSSTQSLKVVVTP